MRRKRRMSARRRGRRRMTATAGHDSFTEHGVSARHLPSAKHTHTEHDTAPTQGSPSALGSHW
jgi:hypothetical protein